MVRIPALAPINMGAQKRLSPGGLNERRRFGAQPVAEPLPADRWCADTPCPEPSPPGGAPCAQVSGGVGSPSFCPRSWGTFSPRGLLISKAQTQDLRCLGGPTLFELYSVLTVGSPALEASVGMVAGAVTSRVPKGRSVAGGGRAVANSGCCPFMLLLEDLGLSFNFLPCKSPLTFPRQAGLELAGPARKWES